MGKNQNNLGAPSDDFLTPAKLSGRESRFLPANGKRGGHPLLPGVK